MNYLKISAIFIFCLLFSNTCFAENHSMMDMKMPGHGQMLTNPIGISPSREGSGTSRLPDSAPMYGIMQDIGNWQLMYHGAAHLVYDEMNGPRGDEKIFLPNWEMAAARRNIGKSGQLRLALMTSLDPLTVGGSGYPLLFQTGETWKDEPLKDQQHPHNFFIETSAMYTHAVNPDSALFLYIAPVGEPALGPVTYMHRTPALDNPLAPIGHHWQDSTHIAYGVVTGGVQTHLWQAELSTFNGREPGENRYEIEGPKFDSASCRISLNPDPNLTLQTSYGYLDSPEELHPEDDAHRVTASAIYNQAIDEDKNFQTSLVWGRNIVRRRNLDSFLIEGHLKKERGWSPYARYEITRKDGEELVLPPDFSEDEVFTLQQATLGIIYNLPIEGNFQWGLGGQLVLNFVPGRLESVYGDNPTGWLVFIRIHPRRM